MLVRIRFRPSAVALPALPRRQQLALGLGALLSPAAVLALALTFWRLGADLGLTGHFVISEGLFSHWQVWLVVAAGLQLGASLLNRYAHGPGSPAHSRKTYGGRDQAMP